MSNTIGKNLRVTLFGESHGEEIGAVLDGMKAGEEVDYSLIDSLLAKRRPSGRGETARIEKDPYRFVSGIFNGKTTGAPICVLIPNENKRSSDYDVLSSLARPSHADYAANEKYLGFQDYRGGGHFSGRLTAPLVALSGLVFPLLRKKGMKICTHILELGGVKDRDLVYSSLTDGEADRLFGERFPVLDPVGEKMEEKIEEAASKKDSIGGVTQTAILHLPVGTGEPSFDSLESVLSSYMFSIGGIKGIEFGSGFAFKDGTGSTMNDEFYMDGDMVKTKTNHNGGINGGIANGMPVVFNCAVKPTSSIGLKQDTVDFRKKENAVLELTGRHDPAIIRRVCVVIDAMTAFAVADSLISSFGKDVL